MLDPETVIEEIRGRSLPAEEGQPLRVFWVRASRDRNGFAQHLRRLRGELPIVPWVLRAGGFRDPNAVMKDVGDVLDSARNDIGAVDEAARESHGIDLVLISRSDLQLADTSSPILLPEWFPVSPGQMPPVRIDDLTWSARVPLSNQAAALDDLRRILHDIDRALVVRLRASREADRRRTQALWDRIRPIVAKGETGKFAEWVEDIKKNLNAVSNPTHYRPSTSKNPTVVGVLWALANRTAPDRLPQTARALTTALNIEHVDEDAVSFAAVLNRPSNPIDDARVRWTFSVIVTLRSACQLVTAAAHADSYPRFGAELLRSTSLDMCVFLDRVTVKLQE